MVTPIGSPMPNLQFLKLGGSLITDKDQPSTARLDVLDRLAGEIAAAFRQQPGLRLVLGHGSGSFGHVPARQYGTRQGVSTSAQWHGFVEVWREAVALNRLVVDALQRAELPALPLAPIASVLAKDGQVAGWDLTPIAAALDHGLLPVVYGDVVFDFIRGGTILSTEDLFAYLARALHPQRLLLAGLEPGVWADYPVCMRLVEQITPSSLPQISANLYGSASTDVTGGMASKVKEMLALVGDVPGLVALIFSGETPGLVEQALLGANPGTRIVTDSNPARSHTNLIH
jgi:isopentenyl phosphate kinase